MIIKIAGGTAILKTSESVKKPQNIAKNDEKKLKNFQLNTSYSSRVSKLDKLDDFIQKRKC